MINILCYGDSNTYGFDPLTGLRYPQDVRWTGRLRKLLGEEYNIIEEGCNGRTTIYEDPVDGWKTGLHYLKPCLNSHKPVDLVILMLGSNDLKKVYHVSAADIATGAARLVEEIIAFAEYKLKKMPQILLVSPPEIGPGIEESAFGWEFDETAITRSKEFPKLYRQVADQYGCLFLDAARVVRSSEADSLHLMPDAHAALAEAFADVIKTSFDRNIIIGRNVEP